MTVSTNQFEPRSRGEVWEVTAIRYAQCSWLRSQFYEDFGVYGDQDGPLDMDYYFWLLRCGDNAVLVDTGFGTDAGARHGRDQIVDPVAALDVLGIASSEVKTVIATHAHYDHIGNLDAFADAQVVVSGAEFDFWTGGVGQHPVFRFGVEADEIAALRRLKQDGALQLVPAEGAEPMPGIRITPVGGHTPGQCVVTVDTSNGPVVLMSDAVHFYEEIEKDRPPVRSADLRQMLQVFADLRAFGDRPDVTLLPGHDPLVSQRFATLNSPLKQNAIAIA